MALTLRGASAELRVGYATAAELGAWHLTRGDGGGWTCSAAVVRRDDYWYDREPLMLVIPFGARRLRFPVESVSGNGTIEITGHGKPETF